MALNSQDSVPVYIILQYGSQFLKFPINPETLRKDTNSSSDKIEVEGIGEVSIQKKPKLSTIDIESFFWQKGGVDIMPPSVYVSWLDRWQKSGRPARLIVTRFNYSMKVTCESFNHWVNAGEEDTTYFSLSMLEYKPYGATQINQNKLVLFKSGILINKLKELENFSLSDSLGTVGSIVSSIPFKCRYSSKRDYSNPYKTAKNDTILSITKKVTGSTNNWKLLYELNSKIIGECAYNESLPTGLLLTLPSSWVKDSSTKIDKEIL